MSGQNDTMRFLIRDIELYPQTAKGLVCNPEDGQETCEENVAEMLALEDGLATTEQKETFRLWMLGGLDSVENQSAQINRDDFYSQSEQVINNWKSGKGTFTGDLMIVGAEFKKFEDYVKFALDMSKKGIDPSEYDDWMGVPPLPANEASKARIEKNPHIFRLYNQAMYHFSPEKWREGDLADKIAGAVIKVFDDKKGISNDFFVSKAWSSSDGNYEILLESYPNELFKGAKGDKTRDALRDVFFSTWVVYIQEGKTADGKRPKEETVLEDYFGKKAELANKLRDAMSFDKLVDGKDDKKASEEVMRFFARGVEIKGEGDVTPVKVTTQAIEMVGSDLSVDERLMKLAGGDSLWRRIAIANLWNQAMSDLGYDPKKTPAEKLEALGDKLIPILQPKTVDELMFSYVTAEKGKLDSLKVIFIDRNTLQGVDLYTTHQGRLVFSALFAEAASSGIPPLDAFGVMKEYVTAHPNDILVDMKFVKKNDKWTLENIKEETVGEAKISIGYDGSMLSHGLNYSADLSFVLFNKDLLKIYLDLGYSGATVIGNEILMGQFFRVPQGLGDGETVVSTVGTGTFRLRFNWEKEDAWNAGFFVGLSPFGENLYGTGGIGLGATGEYQKKISEANKFIIRLAAEIPILEAQLMTASSSDFETEGKANVNPGVYVTVNPELDLFDGKLVLGLEGYFGALKNQGAFGGGKFYLNGKYGAGEKGTVRHGVSFTGIVPKDLAFDEQFNLNLNVNLVNYEHELARGHKLSAGLMAMLNIGRSVESWDGDLTHFGQEGAVSSIEFGNWVYDTRAMLELKYKFAKWLEVSGSIGVQNIVQGDTSRTGPIGLIKLKVSPTIPKP